MKTELQVFEFSSNLYGGTVKRVLVMRSVLSVMQTTISILILKIFIIMGNEIS